MENSASVKLPSAILAFKLLKNAYLTHNEMLVTMAELDFTKKDSLYEYAKSALRKYKVVIVS